MDFKNKIVIVTGGAQGIGRCIAEEFEKLGATVCVIDKMYRWWHDQTDDISWR